MSNLSDFIQAGKGGSENFQYFYEQHTATNGQTVFNLTASYQHGKIEVFINGLFQIPNSGAYTETNTQTITLSEPATTGDNVTFKILKFIEA